MTTASLLDVEYELAGVAEIMKMLGVSRQRVDQLTRRSEFPAPVVELASGRIWESAEIEDWIRTAMGREPIAEGEN